MDSPSNSGPILITFAVPEEAKPFRASSSASHGHCRTLITRVGPTAAHDSLSSALRQEVPRYIVTAGFAGGLNPDLTSGEILYQPSESFPSIPYPSSFRLGRFHSSPRILTTPSLKTDAYQQYHADAVEMESGAIHQLAAKHKIPCLTLRVILDAHNQTLPVDFNPFYSLTGDLQLPKLVFHVLTRPKTIPGLLSLAKQSTQTSRILATALHQLLPLLP